MKEKVAILGSTGSIGVNTLAIIAHLSDKFEVVALSADSNIRLLAEQACKFKPKIVVIRNEALAGDVRPLMPSGIKVATGPEGLKEIISRSDVDTAVFAISGSACLIPLLEAIKRKKKIALANKEALVSGGSLVTEIAKKNRVKIIPIDSEHSAIFQCLESRRDYLTKIYLTGTGGP
ncbi:MAG: 1-deoxy-D-xylulose-5-phosphate reductoisomerase, partial [Candidatus Omnitrophica bacterium]|nr:1-deoxy-D-xylulose-5-phosphate reductoisomerase [Candidatus Omnitrophota bacterium]